MGFEETNRDPSSFHQNSAQFNSSHANFKALNDWSHSEYSGYSHGSSTLGREPERVVVCIDGSNLFYAASCLGLEIDYSKLLQQAVGYHSLVRAYFYTGVDSNNEKQKGFLHWMQRHGYRLVTREVTSKSDGSKTANLDVEIAVDMVQLAKHCDKIVLFSGDGDLAYAVERAAQQGVRFEVISLRSMTSEALLDVADEYVDLEELAPFIRKSPRYLMSQQIAA